VLGSVDAKVKMKIGMREIDKKSSQQIEIVMFVLGNGGAKTKGGAGLANGRNNKR